MNQRSDSGPPPDRDPGDERELQPSWQNEFRDSAESEHLRRLLADLELLNTLRISGFTGPTYEELAKALAEYGYQKQPLVTRSGYEDPARVAGIRSGLAKARELAPQVTREILLLVEEGYSHPEIAAILGITVGAIESRLHRHHKACERRRLNDTA